VNVRAATAVVRTPFKGLTPFDDSALDAEFFFGRERETEIVVANLLASRLTVLYGPSGVGKSSLLRAGVAQTLRGLGEPEPPAVAVLSTWSREPLAGIEEAARAGVAEALGGDPGDVEGSLSDRIQAWTDVLGGELCLILDQLEEFFLYHGDEAGDSAFGRELAELVTRPRLRVNVLLGIRDDALARLDTFKAQIPGLFANSLRLDRLDRDEARAAVLGPLGRYNELVGEDERMSLEPVLLGAVLHEVAAGRIDTGLAGRGGVDDLTDVERIETPYLQLVMQRLWEVERERGSGLLRLATFRELGGAQRIVEDHLERAMAALTPPQRDVAAGMFDHLVTPSGTKIAHGVSDLAMYARVGERDLTPVLASLASQRILRPLGEDGDSAGDRYEIFHDVLADAVLAWRTRHESDTALEQERREGRRRQRRLAAIAGVSLAALALMAVIAVYAVSQRSEAQAQAELADQRAEEAQAAQSAAQASAAEAERQQQEADRQARAAKAAKSRALANEAAAKRAAQEADEQRQKASTQAAAADVARDQAESNAQAASAAQDEAEQNAQAAKAAQDDAQDQARAADRERRNAIAQAAIAKRQRITAEAAAYTARALSLLSTDPEKSLRLVVKAAAMRPSVELERAVRSALLVSRVRAILPAGPGQVLAAQTSSDGRVLLAAGSGGEARLYRTADGKRVARLRHGEPITAAALSQDGGTVATVGGGRLRLWNVTGARSRLELRYPASIREVAFSPDGRLLAAAVSDGSVLLWRVADGHRLHRLPHPRAVAGVSFSPEGRRLLTVAVNARIYDVESGALLAELDQPGAINTARFSPDGALVATGGRDDLAFLWHAGSGERLRSLPGHGGDVLDVAWSPNNQFVATGSSDAGTRLFRADTGALVQLLARQANHVTSVAFSPDGAALVAGSLDGTAWIWSGPLYARGTPLVGHSDAVRRVGFTAGGDRALTAGEDGSVRLWVSRSDPELVGRARHPAAARSVAFSADGRLLVTTGLDRTAIVRRPSGEPIRTIEHPAAVNDGVFSADGRLLLTGSEDGVARLWRVADGRLLRQFVHGAAIRGVALDREASRLATAGADGIAAVWLLRRPERPVRLLRHGGGVMAGVAFSPDGRRLATAGGDGDARVWRLADGRMLGKLAGHEEAVTSVAYSPDGTLLLTASLDADLRLWDARTFARRRTIRGHSSVVSDAVFSSDGRWIATAGPVTVGLWETRTGRRLEPGGPLLFLRGHLRRVRSVAFSPGGRIASVGDDGSLRTFDCEICGRLQPLVELAKRRLATLARPLDRAERRRYLPDV
jgi:WD40 repeat protein/cytoskeletal protein RodZ